MANSTTGDGSYSPNIVAGVGATGTVSIDTGPLDVDFITSGQYYNGGDGDGTITITGDNGIVTVADTDLYAYSRITVGDAFDSYQGTGRLYINNGASVTSTNNAALASGSIPLGGYSNLTIGTGGPFATGTVVVEGAGTYGSSVLSLYGGSAGFIMGADGGTGDLTVSNGGQFFTLTGVIGAGATAVGATGGKGTVTVDGVGSEFFATTNNGNFLVDTDQAPVIFVGQNDGEGYLYADNGGLIAIENVPGDGKSSPTIVFGDDPASYGRSNINGGAELRITQYGPATSGNRLNGDSGLIVGGGGEGYVGVLSAGSQINVLGDRANLVVSLGSYDGQGAPIAPPNQSRLSVYFSGQATVDSQTYGGAGGATVTVGARRLSDGYLQVGSSGVFTVRSDTDLVGDYTTGKITIGDLGSGYLRVGSLGSVYGRELVVGSRGYVANALNNSTDQIVYGYNAAVNGGGDGTVVVNSGDSKIVITGTDNTPGRGILLGQASGTSATLNVDSAGSYVKSTGGHGAIVIGRFGDAAANVTNGGDIYGNAITVGDEAASGIPDTLTISGANSRVVADGYYGRFLDGLGAEIGIGPYVKVGDQYGAVGNIDVNTGGELRLENEAGVDMNPRLVLGVEYGSQGGLDIAGATSAVNVIQQGARFQTANGYTFGGAQFVIGDGGLGLVDATADAQISVQGDGATLIVGGGAYDGAGDPIPAAAVSTLTIGSGADVLIDSETFGNDPSAPYSSGAVAIVGDRIGGDGRIDIDGAGSSLTVTSQTDIAGDGGTGRLIIGNLGAGVLNVSNSATVDVRGLNVGALSFYDDGNGRQYGGYLPNVTAAGTGIVSITTGAQVTATATNGAPYNGIEIGRDSGTVGSATVSGSGTVLTSQNGAGRVRVGAYGDGDLTVDQGGQVRGFFFDIGRGQGSDGEVLVDGFGSNILVSNAYGDFSADPQFAGEAGFLRLGRNAGSDGYLRIANGGRVDVINDPGTDYDNPVVQIGRNNGAYGRLIVDGEFDTGSGIYASTLRVEQTGTVGEYVATGGIGPYGPRLFVGDGGQGVATVSNGGAIEIVGAGARLGVADGRRDGAGNPDTTGDLSSLTISAGSTVVVDSLSYGGTQDFTDPMGATLTGFLGSQVNVGSDAGANGLITVDGAGATLSVVSSYYGPNDYSNGQLRIGENGGAGALNVDNSGAVYGRGLSVGSGAGSVGSSLITNAGSITLTGNDQTNYQGVAIGRDGGVGTVTLQGASTLSSVGGTGRLQVGREGAGTLNIQSASDVEGFFIEVGRGAGSVGVVNIDGYNSRLTASDAYGEFNPGLYGPRGGFIRVGREDGGDGAINITGGGSLNAINDSMALPAEQADGALIEIGRDTGASGYVLVSGDDGMGNASYLRVQNYGRSNDNYAPGEYFGPELRLGRDGAQGQLVIEQGADALVVGERALVTIGRGVEEGDYNAEPTSQVIISSGGELIVDSRPNPDYSRPYNAAADIVIGRETGGNGQLVVSGASSSVTIYSDNATDYYDVGGMLSLGAGLEVGDKGYGVLDVLNGGLITIDGADDPFPHLTVGFGRTGETINARGVATVDGVGSQIRIYGSNAGTAAEYAFGAGGSIDVGTRDGSYGMLTISDGGVVSNSVTNSKTQIAQNTGATGLIVVTGNGSTLNAGTYLTVGADIDLATGEFYDFFSGDAVLTIINQGQVNAGSTYVGSTGILNIDDATLASTTEVRGEFQIAGDNIGTATVQGDLTQRTGALEFDLFHNGAGIVSDSLTASSAVFRGDAITIDVQSAALMNVGDSAILFQTTGSFEIDSLDTINFIGANANAGQQFAVTQQTIPLGQMPITQLSFVVQQASLATVEGDFEIVSEAAGLVALTALDVSISEAGVDASLQTLTASNITGGQLESALDPGVAITTFSQQDVDDRLIRFVSDGQPGGLFDLSFTDTSGFQETVTIEVVTPGVQDINVAEFPQGDAIGFDGFEPGAYLGYSVSGAGDINGDGFDDLIIGATGADGDDFGSGAAFVVFGSPDPFQNDFDLTLLDGSNGFEIRGDAAEDLAGLAVSAIGDVNGDGIGDLAVTAPGANAAGGDAGAGKIYILFGDDVAIDPVISLANLAATEGVVIEGVGPTAGLGASVFGGQDFNGDGVDDIVVGAYGGATLAGDVFVVFGNDAGLTGPASTAGLDGTNGFRVSGLAASEMLGASVSQADLDDDGMSDLIIGASGALGGVGSVFVVKGVANPAANIDVTTLTGADGFRIDGLVAGDMLGASVSTAGDFNGDGVEDIVIAASNATVGGQGDTGSVFVIFGVTGGFNNATFDLTTLDGTNGFRLDGRDFGDLFGSSVASVGDMNDDGFEDILVGASSADPFGMITGEAYLIFGSDEGFAAQQNVDVLTDDQIALITNFDILDSGGFAAGGGFDLNGDGLGDAIVGAPNAGPMDEGGALVVFGAVTPFDPVIEGDLVIEADQGQSGPITTADVMADERDAIPSDLLFHAVNIIGGFIENTGAPGTPIQTFTQADIDAGVIAFAKDAITENASFDLTATDKEGDVSAPVTVNVQTGILANSFKLADLDGNNGFQLNGIAAADQSGLSVSDAGDINGDGFDDVIIGAPQANGGGLNDSGETYIVFGAAGGFPAEIELSALDGTNGFRLSGTAAGDLSGGTVSAAGDINNDGIDDLLVGIRNADRPSFNEGEVVLLYGSTTPFPANRALNGFDGTDGTVINGADFNSLTGVSLSEVGDFNGDDIDDFIIGSPFGDTPAGADAGDSYLIFGADGGLGANFNLTTLNGANGVRLEGGPAGATFGVVAGLGDINDDGFDDVIVGSNVADPPAGANAGQGFVVFGTDAGLPASITLNSVNGSNGFRIDGLAAGDQLLRSASMLGDVNDDGIDDFIISAFSASPNGLLGAGEVYVVFGDSAGFGANFDLSTLDGTNGFVIQGASASDRLGYSVSQAGDFNGDGIGDILVSADAGDPGDQGGAGEAYLIFGKPGGFAATLDLAALDPADGFRLDGEVAGDLAGRSLSAAGDVNGDNRDDLLIGAFSADPNSLNQAGQSYVIFGFGPPQPPRAEDDEFIVDEDTLLSGDLFADNGNGVDIDVDGDPFDLIALNGDAMQVGVPVTLASGATVTVQSDGLFDYDPLGAFDDLADGELGQDQFTYTIGNGLGETSTATVDLTIIGVNDAPFAFDDALSLSEDDTLSNDVLSDNGNGADFDLDGIVLTVVEVDGSPTNVGAPFTTSGGGQITFNPDGTFSFLTNGAYDNLAAGESFDEIFTYTIEDDFGDRATAVLTLTVTGLNDPPVALDDDFVTDEDTGFSGDFFADNGNGPDFDVDNGATFALTSINGNTPVFDTPFDLPNGRGTLTVRSDGTFDFTPSAAADMLAEGQQDQFGFTYGVTDDQGDSSTANVTITLNGLNDAPVALPDDFAISQDDDLTGALFADNGVGPDFDIDNGDTFAITAINGDAALVGQPVGLAGGGSVVVNPDSTFNFSNNGAYIGLAAGQTANLSFTYTITDSLGAVGTTTVDIAVNGLNDAPVALPDDFAFSEQAIAGQFDLFADNGSGADFDVDGDPFAITTANGQQVTPGGLNFFTAGGLGVMITQTGAFQLVDPNNAFDFLDEGETATDGFTYTIRDPLGLTSSTQVEFAITGVNDAPVALDDQVTVVADQTVVFDPVAGGVVGGQDFDPEGGPLTLVTINGAEFSPGDVIALPSGANVAVNLDGTLEYRPSGAFDNLGPNQNAQDGFAYEIEDAGGLRGGAQVNIQVQAPPFPPIARDDQIATTEDDLLIADLFADNGQGPDQNFSIGALLLTGINGAPVADGASVTLGSGAVLTVDETGRVRYDPNGVFDALQTGENATDTFLYTITDADGLQDEGEVTLAIAGANDAPQAANDLFTTDERTVLTADLFADNGAGIDFDVDSTFTVTAVNGDASLVGQPVNLPSGARLAIGPNGGLNFDPNGAFRPLNDGEQASEQITYTITDTEGATDTATFVVRITGITDTVFGTNGDDFIRGTDGADDIDGLAGRDLITGLEGDDSIKGGEGSDIIRGGADDDLLQGGADGDRMFGEGGNDRLEGGGGADRLLGLSGDDTVIGGAGNDIASGGGGDDLVVGADGDDRLRGGRDADTLLGGDGRDSLQGGTGQDMLFGQAGNDNLTGAGGADTLIGGGGIDRLFGRRGNDELTGGEGADRFIFNLGDGFDTITDFEQGVDRIRIGTGAELFGDLTITQVGDDALIEFGNVRILALDENASDFTNSDFIL